ncbi:hypothetical protein SAY86_021588 [Trapa natans]|uniref:Protein BIG GRAIN 1-like A n=1 Tax=Trapa natans TaxID=22666 RepID=A0AAN7MCL1_TRANT|nr:hypothetical protein SAY86_021588 [Trapa natans]
MSFERRQHPTFSSTVLEKIYNSIDEGHGRTTAKLDAFAIYGENVDVSEKKVCETLHESCLLERSLIEKKRVETKPRNRRSLDPDALSFSTSSCSSDSSSGGLYSSSSESESYAGVKTQASCFTRLRLNPLRTEAPGTERTKKTEEPLFQGTDRGSNGVHRTKALNIFEQLKKTKQPVSPGGRLVNFINSLFSSSATSADRTPSKKAGHTHIQKMNMDRAPSTCSSSSSAPPSISSSRSCLSKNRNNATQRTVRFHPVDVVIDERCERKCFHQGEVRVGVCRRLMENNTFRDPIEVRENSIMKEKQRKHRDDLHRKRHGIRHRVSRDEDHRPDGNDDDVISCSSSDLFELPVYETTRVPLNPLV